MWRPSVMHGVGFEPEQSWGFLPNESRADSGFSRSRCGFLTGKEQSVIFNPRAIWQRHQSDSFAMFKLLPRLHGTGYEPDSDRLRRVARQYNHCSGPELS